MDIVIQHTISNDAIYKCHPASVLVSSEPKAVLISCWEETEKWGEIYISVENAKKLLEVLKKALENE